MTTLTTIARKILLLGFMLTAAGRRRIRERHATDPAPTVPQDLPENSTLAGVPLRILLSDRSGPGALMRDTLTCRPSTRDP